MKRYYGLVLAVAATALVPSSGCVVFVGVDGWDCDTRVWVDGDQERVPLDGDGLSSAKVKTHNGAVKVSGQTAGAGEAYVMYRKRAGALTVGGAHDALEAIDVFVEQGADGAANIGWRWAFPKHSDWSASVSFDVYVPEQCDVTARTHNGPVTVTSLTGDVDLQTHNGEIKVDTNGGRLAAQTHNGSITASYGGNDLSLQTHNGRIEADLSRCSAVDGKLITHNGGVTVTVGESASAVIDASTHNGGITCRVPMVEGTIENRKLHGRIGEGEGSLSIRTHNGGVRIERG